MKIRECPLPGAYVIEPDLIKDERGFFARVWDRDALSARGLDVEIAQCSISFNEKAGTLRGMHYQRPPHEETKIVRCTSGGIYDVIVDLRPDSKTRGDWFGIELTAQNRRALYVPKGFAHGFQTLEPATEIAYQISTRYEASAAAGIRHDDPALRIRWPLPVGAISPRDQSYEDWSP